jgi:hypothetical protein
MLADSMQMVMKNVRIGFAKGFVDVERSAGRLWVLGDHLRVREAGDGGDRDAGQKGHPEGPADGRGDQPDEDLLCGCEPMVTDSVEACSKDCGMSWRPWA